MKSFSELAHDLLPILRKFHLDQQAYAQYERLGRLSAHYKSKLNNLVVHRTFEKARRNKVVVGPYHSEIGFEILYWIPFLRWAFNRYDIKPDQVTVISRGRPHDWYRDLAKNYIEIFDYVTPDQLRQYNSKRVTERQTQKQNTLEDFETKLLCKIDNARGLGDFVLIHPMLMYKQFAPYWKYAKSVRLIEQQTDFRYQKPLVADRMIKALPKDYIAIKFYYSACFPETNENKKFVTEQIANLSKTYPVVLLSTGLSIDDHSEATIKGSRVISIEKEIKPENNLDIQTKVLSHAKAFIGTYGGFSYIAPFYGVPSIAFYSNGEKFLPTHLEVANRAYRKIKYGSFYRYKPNHRAPVGKDFSLMTIDTRNVKILKQIFNYN